ncbi:TadE/TadG family type IV pilus assembly protein [Janthinobacterium fluminis]|uniref:TadE/TadG family type IV pilus assembly protein n=1 Tax=Janthinobacterium fluminis TaxID=2987524 RepID=A0ABT5K7S6_9BURK|nr:TadE/TadG family type IV pilus assembly protein [Janthinobacterium fluminis]MDC8760495.1 TadE/TadG family type IV pilus assembly protein [Janthinobacterium fluminis]
MGIERGARPPPQRGLLSVEFALLLALFLGVAYLLGEAARAMYLAVTVQDMTRRAARAAAAADFSDPAAMLAVRQQALLAGAGGRLILGGAIDASYLRIDYLSLDAANAMQPIVAAQLPACPMANLLACGNNPHGAGCIRFVRARLCLPGGGDAACDAVPYQPLLPLLPALFQYSPAAVAMGRATTVVPAATLGHLPGRGC